MRWIAIDPGGTTGVAIWDTVKQEFNTFPVYSGFLGFVEFTHTLTEQDTIVCESFNLGVRGKKIDSTALDIIGALKYLVTTARIERLIMQTPSTRKSVSHEDLDALSLWAKRSNHERDAASHLVIALRNARIEFGEIHALYPD